MLDTVRLFSDVIAAGVLSGASCALVGFYLTNMRLSFLGVCLSHAALAGALVAQMAGLPAWPVVFTVATGTGLLVGPLADATKVETGTSLGILFSMMMGAVFLLVGMMPGPKSEALGLIWGSVLFVRAADVRAMLLLLAAQVAFVIAMDKELRAVLFSREVAALVGIRERLVFYLLLVAASAVVTIHLDIVGGLMLYGLLVTPAATARLLGRSYLACLLWSVAIGVLGTLGGLALSYAFALPTGASIVMMLGVFFAAGTLCERITRSRSCPTA
jgi:manganese/iron transport system permease protein